MDVLGINAFHADASAALVRDGRVVAAAEEERFNRVKHSAGFPIEAIRFCLQQGGSDIRSLDAVALAAKPIENVQGEILQVLSGRPAYSRPIKKRFEAVAKIRDVRRELAKRLGVQKDRIPQLISVPHQVSHLASAFYQSGMDSAALLSLDGFGDFSSTLLAKGSAEGIEIIEEVLFPHSIGIFYTMIAQFLGFRKYGEEGNLMGLAALGEPVDELVEKLRRIIHLPAGELFELNPEYFTHPSYGLDMVWEGNVPIVEEIYSQAMIDAFGQPRFRYAPIGKREWDLAASAHRVFEEAVIHVMTRLREQLPSTRLCYAGSVALNCLANRRIFKQAGFEEIYIPAAPHDAGTAMGCALQASHELGHRSFAGPIYSSRLGPAYSTVEIERALEESGLHYERIANPAKRAAELLAKGRIVGWFQGRMEFGPRALGGRSILADPRSRDMLETLNKRVKYREAFRPFAASILEENFGEYFPPEVPLSPFMLYAHEMRTEKRADVPAVLHEDGTCRIHTVSAKVSPVYHDLIRAFHELSGVPIVLNTSFNENEPIVCSPEDAIGVFTATGMDALVIEDFLIVRGD